MKLKKYNLLFILFIVLTRISSQDSISFNVKSSIDDDYIPYVEVYDSSKGYITTSDANGEVIISIIDSPKIITLFAFEYSIFGDKYSYFPHLILLLPACLATSSNDISRPEHKLTTPILFVFRAA